MKTFRIAKAYIRQQSLWSAIHSPPSLHNCSHRYFSDKTEICFYIFFFLSRLSSPAYLQRPRSRISHIWTYTVQSWKDKKEIINLNLNGSYIGVEQRLNINLSGEFDLRCYDGKLKGGWKHLNSILTSLGFALAYSTIGINYQYSYLTGTNVVEIEIEKMY